MSKRWILLVVVLGSAPFWGTALSIAYFVHHLEDAPPADDEDLRPERTELPANENAYGLLEKATRQLDWPEDDQALRSLIDKKRIESPIVRDLLETNEDALSTLEEAVAVERMQIPEAATELEWDGPLYLTASRRLAHLLSVRSLVHLELHEEGRAFSDALKAVRFGHMIQGAQGTVFHYLLGSELKRIGLERLRTLLPKTSPAMTRRSH